MMMFYDVMLIDDDSVLHKPQRERRRLLEKLVMPIEGKVGITWQKHVQFSKPDGPKRLKEGLAHAFVHRWEGLVLKPSDEPYFDLGRPVKGNYSSRWIKLKKDCIRGLGDSADFVVVGAGYDVTEAFRFTNLDLKWTHFYIGCLKNKVAVVQSGMKPNFLVFDKITECITEEDLVYLNQHGQFPLRAMEPTSVDARETYDVEFAIGLTRPKVIFRKPFVVDVAGSGFDKSSNRDIFTLRFPRVLKVHRDRDWRQAVGLDELQMMATAAMTIPKGDVSEELAAWVEKLDRLDRGVNGQTLSWDYTDNEDEDSEASRDKGPKVTTAKSPRRARTPMAPPLVRMDTGEMLDQEQRLGSGEVVERPRPKHVVDSIPRDNSLQTPLELLPVSRRTDATSEQSSPPGIWRKRTIDSAELQEGLTIWKKSRPSLLQSKSEPQRTKGCNTAAYKKPLGEITNSARSSLRCQSTQLLPQTKQLSATEFSFVGKIAVGADEDFHSRRSKRRMVMEPLSPARETTASESMLTATTQQTTLQHAASTPLPSPTGQRGQASFMPTPVSSAERSTEEDMRDLKKRQLIVSPCLMDGDHPLQVLMARHSIVPSSLPNKTPCPACAPPEHSIIFLVEPNNTSLTGSYIRSLVRHIPAWHPRSIRVWDWRIVEAMLKREIGNVQDSKKRAKEAFFAKLSWDPEEELVEVQWRDGEPSWVPKEDMERADWSGR
jgi:DNA ligase-4